METNNNQNSAAELFTGFEENSSRILLFREEMRFLLEHSFTTHQMEQLHAITFTAKYINGMKRVINSAANNPEIKNTDEIKKDLSLQMGKVIEQIRTLIEQAPDAMKVHLTQNFLEMTPQAFINLSNLLSDLEQLKIYFNRLREAQ